MLTLLLLVEGADNSMMVENYYATILSPSHDILEDFLCIRFFILLDFTPSHRQKTGTAHVSGQWSQWSPTLAANFACGGRILKIFVPKCIYYL